MNGIKQTAPVVIRWLIRKDMRRILQIENASFDCPWTEDEFLSVLRERNCIGMVAEHEKQTAGMMIYELERTRLHILNFAVAPEFRRLDVGTQMIEKLHNKLSQQRRTELILEVRESNLGAQLFFKAQGFRAVKILPGYYEETGEDAYQMVWRMPAESVNEGRGPAVNRISQY